MRFLFLDFYQKRKDAKTHFGGLCAFDGKINTKVKNHVQNFGFLLKAQRRVKLKKILYLAFHFGGLCTFDGKTNIKIKNHVQISGFLSKAQRRVKLKIL